MDRHTQTQAKLTSAPIPAMPPAHSGLLPQQEQEEPDRSLFPANDWLRSPSPSSPSQPPSPPPINPSVGHSFGSMAIGPTTSPMLQRLPMLQRKLAIGQPDDRYEQEADQVADQVMRMPAPKIQRLYPECKEELQRQPMAEEEKKKEDETLQTKPLAETITPLIQRQMEPTEEEEKKKEEETLQTKPLAGSISPLIQRQTEPTEEEKKKKEEETLQTKPASGEASTVSPALQNQITALQGGGQPLPESERHFFEPRFGADFSQVRVHAGGQAAEAARAVNARAFTLGRDVVFGAGEYQPRSTEGQRLLAHELTHVMQQRNSLYRVLHRKCEVDSALNYYKKNPQGKKVDYSEWLEKMRKVVGTGNKLLYDNAKTEGKIDRAFVLLICKGQKVLNIREDGKLGSVTARVFDEFATGGAKGIDYTRLFKDKKLEVGIAIGDEFKDEFLAIVALLETEGKKLKNFSSSGSSDSKVIKFTKEFPVQGDNTAAPIAIDVEVSIISAASTNPKQTYTEFLSQKEIVIYSGHARYGTGPDFDDKKSVKENFIIGVNSALHKAGKLTKGYDEHMNKILEGYGNDLEAMSKAGKIDPDKYQVWFFNACSSIQYLDEVRNGLVTDKSGKKKSKANLRFVGTQHSIYSDALKIVEAILNMKTMKDIIRIMNVNEREEVKARKEKPAEGYYFSD
jgi:hypothetical protein